ncbi:thiomuracin/GE37468 family thiazolyl RiPP peptide [Dactylosporangium sp. NPDC051541]|uniref:thiomuracin/GE37468 family thiazolyl RiPP peptide n=1 Tax=Dactylosporangium sp. NPDC051541 TaxID=3363977 RepID=UPI0037B3CAD4
MGSDPAAQRAAGDFAALSFQLDDLPIDVFEVDGSGLTVESLTGGHGMTETGASCPLPGNLVCICSCWQQ